MGVKCEGCRGTRSLSGGMEAAVRGAEGVHVPVESSGEHLGFQFSLWL